MNFKTLDRNNQDQLTGLFTDVFSSSEGEDEGKLIGNLVAKLSFAIDNQAIICLGAYEESSLIAAIFLTRLRFEEDVQVYMLAPVAVSTAYQGQGAGQALINYGIDELKSRSAAVLITYGDPAYYAKVGFQPLSEEVIQAPLKMSMPEGWLGQSLREEPIPVLKSRPLCVKAFNDPVYW